MKKTFVYGYLTDFSCWLFRGITVNSYVEQFATMLVSCVILAFGIWIQFKGGVAMLPGEAMNRCKERLSHRLDKSAFANHSCSQGADQSVAGSRC